MSADPPPSSPDGKPTPSGSSGPGPEPGAASDMPMEVGKYRITKWLGAGDLGEVWLGEDEYSNEVAVKMIRATGPFRERFLQKFLRKAHTLSVLQHRNICRTYTVEEREGRPFVIMEHVEGVNLDTLLSHLAVTTMIRKTRTTDQAKVTATDIETVIGEVEGHVKHPDSATRIVRRTDDQQPVRTLPLQQALSIVIKLCDAVQYAHERGVFHQDIKPPNIMVRPDGEPVLLDFGVASLVSDYRRDLLERTGQYPGSVEYMAPEQELSGGGVDERADVYSLGAVLYQLLTGRKLFETSGNVVLDKERLRHHQLSRVTAQSQRIDRELEAIVLKAVAPDREQRYRSARSLAQDLARYQEGQAVLAKRPTPLYLFSKFVKRNALGFTLSVIIAALSFLLAGYYAIDYYRHWGNWIRAFEHDFLSRPHLGGQFEFVDTTGARGRPWVIDSVGLFLGQQTWCWLRDVHVAGNVRVVLRLHFDNMPDGFEIALNSAPDSLQSWFHVPRGYSCQVGGYLGTLDFISINKTPGVARAANPVPSAFEYDHDVTITFQREGERITLFVNGHKQVETRDVFPLWGPDFARIGFRSFATATHVRSIEVYRMSLPEKASPLVAGDALATYGHGRDAIKAYLGIADDFEGTEIAEKALVRSYHAIYQLNEPYKSHLADSVGGIYGKDLRDTPSWQDVREMQMIDLWKDGRFEQVLRMLREHYREYDNASIALELMGIGARVAVPDSVRDRLFVWATRTKGVNCLNAPNIPAHALANVKELSSLGYLSWGGGNLTSLDPLSSLKLNWLVVNNNQIGDLSPLWGQPLSYLNCSGNRVSDLGPLVNAPLKTLTASANRLLDVAPLRFCPLRYLDVRRNRIRDLSPLAGREIHYLYVSDNDLATLRPLEDLPVRILDCSNNRIETLSPMRRMPLTELRCNRNVVSGLVPLTGKPLQHLQMSENFVEDLTPLLGLPLRQLSCARNRIQDVSPLRGMHLRSLDISGNRIRDISPLTGMPIEILDCSNNEISDFGPIFRMKLRTLRCGGNQAMPLQAIAKLGLRELQCASSGLSDLWPLAGSRLQTLDCSDNLLEDIGPLATIPLTNLNCADNRLRSIDKAPLGEVRFLDCSRNRIRTLSPLLGHNLAELVCEDNPISSLHPLVANPPTIFRFFTPTLPVPELLRAAEVWDKASGAEAHARNARILACINADSCAGLAGLARQFGEHRYLHVPWHVARGRAASIARRAGGHLLQLEAPLEWLVLRDSLGASGAQGVWAGVHDSSGVPQWDAAVSGTRPSGIVYDADAAWAYMAGHLCKVTGERRQFAIEWEAVQGSSDGTRGRDQAE